MEEPSTLASTPDEIAKALSKSSRWPVEGAEADWIQTHISHVFLVGDLVFKLRKAVRLPFLDFGTRANRNADCLREVALNRRLARSVYLGIAPVVCEEDAVYLGPIGETLTSADSEHVVVMRRLTEGRDALSLLDRNLLEPQHLEAIASLLVRFHAKQALARPAPWQADTWLKRTVDPALESLASVAESNLLPERRIRAMERTLREKVASLGPRFEERRVEGRAVDAHGDLHLDHVWFEERDAEPLIIDCLEFNEDLRLIDRASEVAFLAMDLRYRGRTDLAEWFLSAYAMQSDDYGLFSVVDFFTAYRALVRAKVAALAAQQSSIVESQRQKARTSVDNHFVLAESLLEKPASPSIVVICGTVGSGKTTLARCLARVGDGIPISSDRVRKALAGVSATTHSGEATDEGIYQPEHTERVYRGLLDRASLVLSGGRNAILDAAFGRRSQRDAVRSWAADHGVEIRLIEARCDPENARVRLEDRARVGTDPSDAGPDFLHVSEARFEPPDEWPRDAYQAVYTDDAGWQEKIVSSRPVRGDDREQAST